MEGGRGIRAEELLLFGPMPNPQLDQFMHALMWKAVPTIFLAGIAGLLLRESSQWLERKAAGVGRARRAKRDIRASADTQKVSVSAAVSPHCPSCNGAMVKRTARRGANAGSEFWGCQNYPKCHGTRDA